MAIFSHIDAQVVCDNLALLLSFVVALVLIYLTFTRQRYPKVPTLRLSKKPWILGTREDARLWTTNAITILLAGYEKYSSKNLNYLVNRPEGKLLIVAPKFVEEVRRAPETHVQNTPANNDLTQLKHTLSVHMTHNQFHHDIPLRKSLTESLGPRLPDIVEEAKLSIKIRIGEHKEWTSHKMYPLGFRIVTRTANRLLFGIPLTRNPEFEQLSIDYAGVLFGGAEIIRGWPEFLKPLIMWLKTDIHRTQKIANRLLYPVIQDRLDTEDRYVREGRADEWQKVKPEDVIQWVLDVAPPKDRRVDHLTHRMLHINIGAIHTSSVSFLEAFYFLSIYPQYHAELREEVEEVIRQEGAWTKQAITHFKRVDSFIAEAVRMCPFTALKLQRQVVKDWEMSDGTLIPKGVYFWCNYFAQSMDNTYWDKAIDFDPWRMYRLRQEPGKENMHQLVMTSPTNLTFGHGKHACPGRFFAANELKALMALIIMLYDVRCSNIKSKDEVVRGGWINQTKDPIKYPVVDFRYRGDEIPEDVRDLFTKV